MEAVGPPPAPTAVAPRHWRRRFPLTAFLVRRIAAGLVLLLATSAFIFFATQILPGNVAQVVLGRNATPQSVASLEAKLGLDEPVVTRYVDWLGNAVTGDFGDSAVQLGQGAKSAPVASELGEPLRNSLILAGITVLLMIPLSFLLGVYAATRAGKPGDHITSLTSLVIGAFPEFVFGTLLILVFFSLLNVLPPVALVPPGTSPLAEPEALVLPILTLLGVTLAAGIRQVRGGMIDVLESNFVALAEINGLPRRRILWRYALRNALPASIQIIAQNILYLLGGIIIVESVFAYPGVGTFLVEAVNTRDVTAVEAVSLILAAIYISINILADFLVVVLVPKLRTRL
ncbi:MAG: ABC transporter permease [Actinobacteria bacterium]|nr:ABC transporter permease [Actinomycetota bacterium]